MIRATVTCEQCGQCSVAAYLEEGFPPMVPLSTKTPVSHAAHCDPEGNRQLWLELAIVEAGSLFAAGPDR